MSVLRRAWRVYADKPTSEAAGFLRILIPMETLFVALRFLPSWDFPWPSTTLVDVIWLYVVLWFVRQRDEARTARAEDREDAPEVLGRARPDRPPGW